jgi:GNAT superfamily N-acetyltransferase
LPVEIVRVSQETLTSFYRENEREALRTFYGFPVIWQEAEYGFAAQDEANRIIAAATLRVAASLGHLDRIVVAPQHRRNGIGRKLLDAAADVANYYNCHKMTTLVVHDSPTQRFFEACGYRQEAILPQHTFKLDMAMMRKFLL